MNLCVQLSLEPIEEPIPPRQKAVPQHNILIEGSWPKFALLLCIVVLPPVGNQRRSRLPLVCTSYFLGPPQIFNRITTDNQYFISSVLPFRYLWGLALFH